MVSGLPTTQFAHIARTASIQKTVSQAMQQKKFLGLLLTLKKGATMTQRKKLIELIHEFGFSGYEINDLADYLLANGVVVLPCKVGDTVWSASPFTDGKVREGYISAFFVDEVGAYGFNAYFGVECGGFLIEEIGMTVFFTKEEAEKALEKRKGGE